VALGEGRVEPGVGVVAELADPLATKAQDDAGPLVDHVAGRAPEPAPLTDLDHDALHALEPLAPHVLVDPVGGTEAELAAGERPEHRLAPAPLAADRRRACHPVDDVVVKSAATSSMRPAKRAAS